MKLNHGEGLSHLGSIKQVRGTQIPKGSIVRAGYPCQELSLAGKMGDLAASRSDGSWGRRLPVSFRRHRLSA